MAARRGLWQLGEGYGSSAEAGARTWLTDKPMCTRLMLLAVMLPTKVMDSTRRESLYWSNCAYESVRVDGASAMITFAAMNDAAYARRSTPPCVGGCADRRRGGGALASWGYAATPFEGWGYSRGFRWAWARRATRVGPGRTMCHIVRKHGNVKRGPSLPRAHLFTKLSEMLSTSHTDETSTARAMSASRHGRMLAQFHLPKKATLWRPAVSGWRRAFAGADGCLRPHRSRGASRHRR